MTIDRTSFLQRYPNGGPIYFRKGKGAKRVASNGPLPGVEGSAEFNAEYDRLLAMAGASPKRGRPFAASKVNAKPTIGLFVARYRASDFFAHPCKPNLKEKPYAEGTQANYQLGLDLLHAQGVTALSFADLTSRKANLYIQKIKREHGGSCANLQMILLSNLWKFSRQFPDFDGGDRHNPMKGGEIDQPYRVQQEHMPWPEQVQEEFLAACDQNLYDAFHMLICTGQRVSDVAKMKREHFDGVRFSLVQKKDRTKTPIKIKAQKKLRDILEARVRRLGGEEEYLLTHKWGRPYTGQSLSARIREVLQKIGHSEYTTHGLRKNAGIKLAENGAQVPQIMAALGHKTPKMALYYCRLANQTLLADQAADILDIADANREGRDRVAQRRGQIRRVK